MANNPLTGGFSGVGQATGSITVETGSLREAGQQARAVGRQIEQSFEGVDRSARQVEQSIGGVARSVEKLGSSVADAIPFGKIGGHGLPVIDMEELSRARQEAANTGRSVRGSLEQIETGGRRARAGLREAKQGLDEFDESSRRTESGLGRLVATFGGLSNVLTAVVGAKIVQVGFNLAQTAAQADRVRDAFNQMAARAGESGDQMLAAMRKASRGQIDDANLVLAANQAMLLNVAHTADEMAQLVEVARVRAQAMGLDTTQALSDIVRGIGRLSPLILDNLGIITDAENTYARYAASLGRTADSLTDAEKRQALLQRVIRETQPMIAAQAGAAENNADKFERMSASFVNAKKAVGDLLLAMGTPEAIDTFTRSIEDSRQQIEWLIARIRELQQMLNFRVQIDAQGAAIAALTGGPPMVTGGGGGFGGGGGRGGFGGVDDDFDANAMKRRDMQIDFARQLMQIDRQAADARLDATRSFEQQRSQTISDYERSIAREAEDFGRQRLRQQQQLERQIASVQEDAARRTAKAIEDLAERIADLQADSARRLSEAQVDSNRRIADAQESTNKRVAEIERDYHRDRERAERDHRDRLMDAAARLDAAAVFNEQRNFRRQQQDANEAHRERIDKEQDQLAERIRKEQESLAERTRKEQENLAERIAQEQRAHAKRLREAKEADDRRLADMRADFARRQAEEDADRAVRLRRMAEDHQAQLAQQAAAHSERIAQINRHQTEERKAAEDAHLTEMQRLGGTVAKGWLLVQEAIQKAMLESYDKFQEELNKRFATQGPQPAPQFPINPFRGFADGGPVMRTGLARVHSGEFILSKSMVQAINNATGGRVGSSAARSGGSSLTLADGAIQVFAAPGMSEQAVARAVRGEIAGLFRELAEH